MTQTTPAPTTEPAPERAAAAAAFLAEATPGDALEAMLVEQMAAVHAAAMRCLSRAEACGEHPEIEARYLREGARLLHLFQRQSDALDRRRIAAEDRAGARERTERMEARDWRRETDRAKRTGEPAPPPPPRCGSPWPAWPERREGPDGRGRAAKARNGSGRGNGAARPG
jgi:hypothetical protein